MVLSGFFVFLQKIILQTSEKMKKLVISLLLAIPCLVHAQGLQKGYRGMVDLGSCIYTSQLAPSTVEITTSHVYQFNPYIYIGVGLASSKLVLISNPL